jgi:hypothetical protein
MFWSFSIAINVRHRVTALSAVRLMTTLSSGSWLDLLPNPETAMHPESKVTSSFRLVTCWQCCVFCTIHKACCSSLYPVLDETSIGFVLRMWSETNTQSWILTTKLSPFSPTKYLPKVPGIIQLKAILSPGPASFRQFTGSRKSVGPSWMKCFRTPFRLGVPLWIAINPLSRAAR